jgi:uncharacterized protein YodC (DUF2158 family)
MSISFKVGDTVKLKAGGPDMSVQSIPKVGVSAYYSCQWFAGKKLESGKFPEDSLIAVVPAPDSK